MENGIVVGWLTIPEVKNFKKSYESAKYQTDIEIMPCSVQVVAYRNHMYLAYEVSGKVVRDNTDPNYVGKPASTGNFPYPYDIIKNPNFKPNEKFFEKFGHLLDRKTVS